MHVRIYTHSCTSITAALLSQLHFIPLLGGRGGWKSSNLQPFPCSLWLYHRQLMWSAIHTKRKIYWYVHVDLLNHCYEIVKAPWDILWEVCWGVHVHYNLAGPWAMYLTLARPLAMYLINPGPALSYVFNPGLALSYIFNPGPALSYLTLAPALYLTLWPLSYFNPITKVLCNNNSKVWLMSGMYFNSTSPLRYPWLNLRIPNTFSSGWDIRSFLLIILVSFLDG